MCSRKHLWSAPQKSTCLTEKKSQPESEGKQQRSKRLAPDPNNASHPSALTCPTPRFSVRPGSPGGGGAAVYSPAFYTQEVQALSVPPAAGEEGVQ